MSEDKPQVADLPTTPFPLDPALVLLTRRGSEAHGLKTPPTDPNAIDDRDLMGFVIPPMRYYTGLGHWEGAEAIKGCWDTVLYEWRKGIRLLMKQNVNTLTAIWCDEEDVLVQTEVGQLLREMRMHFRHAALARDTFVGYARAQLKRMTAFDRPTMERISDLEEELRSRGIEPDSIL